MLDPTNVVRRRVLLAGPCFTRQTGGLERALADVARGLRELGFAVDDATGATSVAEADATTRAPARTALAALNRHPWLLRRWARLDVARRRALRDVFVLRATIEHEAALLQDLERRIVSGGHDVVLYCVEEAPRGGLALALALHPRVIAVAIEGLAAELSVPAPLERWLRWRGASAHRWFGVYASADTIRCAILSSLAWLDATVRAGLSRDAAHAVYFGVPVPAVVRPDRRFDGRLLFVGRLVKDKGLHVLLAGVARARRIDPRIRLTIVAGDGPQQYRALLDRRIDELGLTDVVQWHGPLRREELSTLYAQHDALLFWSPFVEPAPLVAMEAMAAQLPAVMPHPASASPIYENDVSCVTYDRNDPESLARDRRSRRRSDSLPANCRGRCGSNRRVVHAAAHGARLRADHRRRLRVSGRSERVGGSECGDGAEFAVGRAPSLHQ